MSLEIWRKKEKGSKRSPVRQWALRVVPGETEAPGSGMSIERERERRGKDESLLTLVDFLMMFSLM